MTRDDVDVSAEVPNLAQYHIRIRSIVLK